MRINGIFGGGSCARAYGHAIRPSFLQAKSNHLPMPWSVTTEGPGTEEVPE